MQDASNVGFQCTVNYNKSDKLVSKNQPGLQTFQSTQEFSSGSHF